MNYQSRTQLRFEPSGLGRHDIAGIGNVHQLLHGHRITRQSHFHLTADPPLLHLAQPAEPADNGETLVGTEVFDTEDFIQYQVGRNGNIQHADRVIVVVSARLCRKAVPLAVQVKGEVMQACRLVDFGSFLF